MKKKLLSLISAIVSVALLLSICGVLVGCNADSDTPGEYDNVEYVPTKVPEQIADNYLAAYDVLHKNASQRYGEFTKDALLYYGEYGNNAHVIYPSGLSIVLYWRCTDEVAGCVFNYSDSMKLDVFYENNIYDLKEAYDNGIMSRDDIRLLRSRFSTKILNEKAGEAIDNAYNKYIDYNVEYVPTNAPEHIADNYLAAYDVLHKNASQRYGEFTKDALLYYGEYGNNAHVIYPSGLSIVLYWRCTDEVAGCVFNYSDSMKLDVFYENNIYDLEEAYDNGIMSRDDIRLLRSRFSTKILNEKAGEAIDNAYNSYKEQK